MIVEDIVVMQEILKEILGLKGHSVIFLANDGIEAVDYYLNPNNDYPDIIIMDHRLPNKDGLTALKEILAIDSKAKIIFVSGDESVKNDAINFGAKGYMIKPISALNLLSLIDNVHHN